MKPTHIKLLNNTFPAAKHSMFSTQATTDPEVEPVARAAPHLLQLYGAAGPHTTNTNTGRGKFIAGLNIFIISATT